MDDLDAFIDYVDATDDTGRVTVRSTSPHEEAIVVLVLDLFLCVEEELFRSCIDLTFPFALWAASRLEPLGHLEYSSAIFAGSM
jgi:hypothetical protein